MPRRLKGGVRHLAEVDGVLILVPFDAVFLCHGFAAIEIVVAVIIVHV